MLKPRPKRAPDGALSILDAAERLFSENGYESVSVAAIADLAGVCKANVFHHYASKDALYLAVMQRASDEHAAVAETVLAQDVACVDKLRQIADLGIRVMLENPPRTRLILRELGEPCDSRVRELAHQVFSRNFGLAEALFEQGKRQGEFRADLDSVVAATALCGALNAFFLWRDTMPAMRHLQGDHGAETFARETHRLLVAGVLRDASATATATASTANAAVCGVEE